MEVKKVMKAVEAIKEAMNEKTKVIKSVPMKPVWTKMHEECMVLADKLASLKCELDTKRKLMWATIETDLGIFDKQLQINTDTTEVNVLEDDEEGDK